MEEVDSVEGNNNGEEAEGTKRAEVVESKEGTKSAEDVESAEGTKRAEEVESAEGTKSAEVESAEGTNSAEFEGEQVMGIAEWSKSADVEHAEEIVKVVVDCDVPVVFIFSADSSLLQVQLSCAFTLKKKNFIHFKKFFVRIIWLIA